MNNDFIYIVEIVEEAGTRHIRGIYADRDKAVERAVNITDVGVNKILIKKARNNTDIDGGIIDFVGVEVFNAKSNDPKTITDEMDATEKVARKLARQYGWELAERDDDMDVDDVDNNSYETYCKRVYLEPPLTREEWEFEVEVGYRHYIELFGL